MLRCVMFFMFCSIDLWCHFWVYTKWTHSQFYSFSTDLYIAASHRCLYTHDLFSCHIYSHITCTQLCLLILVQSATHIYVQELSNLVTINSGLTSTQFCLFQCCFLKTLFIFFLLSKLPFLIVFWFPDSLSFYLAM